ncbi:hypothetical protein MNEG_6226, partial [Monoraphidium neglectum]
ASPTLCSTPPRQKTHPRPQSLSSATPFLPAAPPTSSLRTSPASAPTPAAPTNPHCCRWCCCLQTTTLSLRSCPGLYGGRWCMSWRRWRGCWGTGRLTLNMPPPAAGRRAGRCLRPRRDPARQQARCIMTKGFAL